MIMGKDIKKRLNITLPIIQAPMAGGMTTPHFVSNVVKNGAFGMLASGYLSPVTLRQQIKSLKELGVSSFGVNVFVPNVFNVSHNELNQAFRVLEPYYDELAVSAVEFDLPLFKDLEDDYHQIIDIIIEEKVFACSFTFGLPDSNIVARLKSAGIFIMGTATNLQEALAMQDIEVDAVILQGCEAGGHRGHFLEELVGSFVPLDDLVLQVRDKVKLPIIAAGGLMDCKDVQSIISLGADAVQMGTALLVCEESGANLHYKEVLIACDKDTTTLTKAFSGKWARGVSNSFTRGMAHALEIAEYPLQNALTQQLRKESARIGNTDFMSLWAGQGVAKAQKQTVQQLFQQFQGL